METSACDIPNLTANLTSFSMASILSVNDDCLCELLSYIDDPRTFYNISLTCKRLVQVTKCSKKVLHSNLLHVKAKFYMKSFIADALSTEYVTDNIEECKEYCILRNIVDGALQLAQSANMLTYARVVDVWERYGPVAATLTTWMRNEKFRKEYDEPHAGHVTEENIVLLDLPGCGKNMSLNGIFSYDPGQINRDSGFYIYVNCGELDVDTDGATSESFLAVPVEYRNWKEEEMSAVIYRLKPMIKILQTELGETVPPVTNQFFFWLCFFFTDTEQIERHEQKLYFKEAYRNGQPTPAFVQAARELSVQQAESKFQKSASEWKNGAQSSSSNMILEAIDLLAHRSEAKLLKSLDEEVVKFYNML